MDPKFLGSCIQIIYPRGPYKPLRGHSYIQETGPRRLRFAFKVYGLGFLGAGLWACELTCLGLTWGFRLLDLEVQGLYVLVGGS